VLVQDFSPEGKAARDAGLEAGDIIVAVDGQPVEYTAQLQQRIAFRKPGESAKIEVARKGGVHKTLTVPLQAVADKGETASRNVSNDAGSDEKGAAPMAALGITVAPLDRQARQELELPDDMRGVVVTDVTPGGPAYESVIGPDNGGPDIIRSVEGKAVDTPQQLRDALKGYKPGDIVTLRLYNPRAKTNRIERVRLDTK
jgi:serine protease Do